MEQVRLAETERVKIQAFGRSSCVVTLLCLSLKGSDVRWRIGSRLIPLRLLCLTLWWLKQRQILTVPFFFQLFDRNKPQRRRVHTKTLSGGSGAVIENVTEV